MSGSRKFNDFITAIFLSNVLQFFILFKKNILPFRSSDSIPFDISLN